MASSYVCMYSSVRARAATSPALELQLLVGVVETSHEASLRSKTPTGRPQARNPDRTPPRTGKRPPQATGAIAGLIWIGVTRATVRRRIVLAELSVCSTAPLASEVGGPTPVFAGEMESPMESMKTYLVVWLSGLITGLILLERWQRWRSLQRDGEERRGGHWHGYCWRAVPRRRQRTCRRWRSRWRGQKADAEDAPAHAQADGAVGEELSCVPRRHHAHFGTSFNRIVRRQRRPVSGVGKQRAPVCSPRRAWEARRAERCGWRG